MTVVIIFRRIDLSVGFRAGNRRRLRRQVLVSSGAHWVIGVFVTAARSVFSISACANGIFVAYGQGCRPFIVTLATMACGAGVYPVYTWGGRRK